MKAKALVTFSDVKVGLVNVGAVFNTTKKDCERLIKAGVVEAVVDAAVEDEVVDDEPAVDVVENSANEDVATVDEPPVDAE